MTQAAEKRKMENEETGVNAAFFRSLQRSGG